MCDALMHRSGNRSKRPARRRPVSTSLMLRRRPGRMRIRTELNSPVIGREMNFKIQKVITRLLCWCQEGADVHWTIRRASWTAAFMFPLLA